MKLRPIVEAALCLMVLCMAASMAWSLYHKTPAAATANYVSAPTIAAAEKIRVVTVPGPPRIVTIEKERVVEKLKLPDAIAKDPDRQVVATAEVAPYAGKTDAIALLDTRTGRAEIDLRQEPLPFFGFEDGKEVGARAGAGLHGPEGAAYARWTFARTGRLFWAAYGELTAPIAQAPIAGAAAQANGKLMLDVSYRW